MLPTSMSFRCSLSEVALLIARIAAADATAQQIPMIASWRDARVPDRIVENTTAPMNVNARLIQ